MQSESSPGTGEGSILPEGWYRRLFGWAVINGSLLILYLAFCGNIAAQPLVWVAQGPGPNTGGQGQVENIADGEVAGALKAVAPHPTDPNTVYVGAVNGGIWKTTNAMAASPAWTPQTDSQRSLSIGALEFDPTDNTNQTLVAGIGRFSNFFWTSDARGGALIGLLRTIDGGTSWTSIDGGGILNGLNISGVAPRGEIIVLSVDTTDSHLVDGHLQRGIYRSTDTGATWTQISGRAGTGLPFGPSFDLAGDPTNPARLFTEAFVSFDRPRGLYRSTDTGATWSKVSNAEMDTLISDATNVKIAVGTSNNVYVAIVRRIILDGRRFDRLAGVFRSGNGGDSWTKMDLPMDADGGIHPGGGGIIDLSIAADPNDANVVYLGGDHQDVPAGGRPNTIGAFHGSGRLVRGNASRAPGGQFVHLTHSSRLGPASGGTVSSSAPHADSRDMKVAANGVLIEVDDGGIYRRTNPRTNAGDWFSMNGDIQPTEFHTVAWDANAHIVIGGTQDIGTPEQQVPGNIRWRSVSGGDGGVVAVDDSSTPGLSIRYSSEQFLRNFRRRVYNAANVLQSEVLFSPVVIGGGAVFQDPRQAQFYTPVVVNAVTPTWLIIGGANSVYESLDQGDTIREIGPGIRANGDEGHHPIAYGAAGNPDVLYVGSGVQVFVRTAAHPAALTASATYPGGDWVAGIAIDANDPQTVFVVDSTSVYRTTDAGATWTDITGNLGTLDPGILRSITYSTGLQGNSVVVGSDTGVFHAPGPAFTSWSQFGTGLPKAPVLHLEYDAVDEVLLAGTLGRGAWALQLGGQPKAVPRQVGAQRDAAMNDFKLRPGVVVDPGRRVAYVMSPEGGIDAVELTGGGRLWSSRAAAKPLALARQGDLLVSQAEPAGAENELTIATLDTRQGGKRVVASTTELPPGVKATIDNTLNSSFRTAARTAGGDALVSWQQTERIIRGAPLLEEEVTPPRQPPQKPTPYQPSVTSGSFRMDISSGSISPLSAEEAPAALDVQAPELAGGERLQRVSGPQFFSADGRHVLSSQRVADDRVWDKYQWTIYDRATGERVGGFRTFISFTPFFVVDQQVVYETPPFMRQMQDRVVEESLKIRAVDLQTGQEVWNHEVRDTEYRGPSPP